MEDSRGNYGIPVIRSLVTKDGQKLRGTPDEPARINFVFSTSFLGTTPGEESVFVEKISGKWQVYYYKFRPSGKPPAHRTNAKIKKTWEEQTDDNDQYPSYYSPPSTRNRFFPISFSFSSIIT